MDSLRSLRLAACLSPLVVACGEANDTAPSRTITRDSAGIRIIESSAPLFSGEGDSMFVRVDPAPAITIGVGEGDETYELHRVSDAMRLADGRIAISNSGSGEIRVFDANGKYVTSVGRRGAGPGEFSEYSNAAMHAVGDSVLALDDGAFRAHLFGPDLRFVETRSFAFTSDTSRPYMRGVLADGSWLALAAEGGGTLSGRPPGTIIRMRYTHLRYDAKGKPLNTMFRTESRPRYVHQMGNVTNYPFIPFAPERLDAVSGNEIVVLRGTHPELEVYDTTGQLIRIVRWNAAARRTSDVWDRYKAMSLAGMAESRRASYEHYYGLELPLPEFVPPYAAMHIDAAHRAWFQRYRIAGDTGLPAWDVLDRDGTWLGSAKTPHRFTIYRIGDNYILGRHLDSLGVERVQSYRFHTRAR